MKVGFKDLQNLTRRLYLNLESPEAQTETISDVLSSPGPPPMIATRRGEARPADSSEETTWFIAFLEP